MYFGWYIVGLAGFIYMLLVGTTVGAFGLFVLPVSQDLGLSRADINTSFILLQIGSALLSPFIGRALDRFPVRNILAVAAVMFGLSLALIALSSSTLLSALVILLMLPIALEGAGAMAFSVIIVRWFAANRGKAMLFFNIGGPLSAILVIPVVAQLMGSFGWRHTLLISGISVMLLILVTAFFIRERPAPGESESRHPGVTPTPSAPLAKVTGSDQAEPASVGEVLRMPLFWILGLAYALPMAVALAVAISLYPFAIQEGFSPPQATGLMSTTGISAIGGALLVSLVIDRVDRRLLLAGMFLTDGIAIALMPAGLGYEVMLFAVLLLGISSGVLLPAMMTYQADVFGSASFGTVRGLMSPLVSVVGAIMVRFAGEVFDRTGHYDLMFFSFVGVEVFSAMLLGSSLFLKPLARKLRNAEEQSYST